MTRDSSSQPARPATWRLGTPTPVASRTRRPVPGLAGAEPSITQPLPTRIPGDALADEMGAWLDTVHRDVRPHTYVWTPPPCGHFAEHVAFDSAEQRERYIERHLEWCDLAARLHADLVDQVDRDAFERAMARGKAGMVVLPQEDQVYRDAAAIDRALWQCRALVTLAGLLFVIMAAAMWVNP